MKVIWVKKDSEFYHRSIKSWLEKKWYEGKFFVAERFIRALKNKIYKYMTSFSKNFYIDKLDDIVHKYNNTYHNTIKMKLVDVKSNTYNDSNEEINDQHSKFKIGVAVRISKYQNIFCKRLHSKLVWRRSSD